MQRESNLRLGIPLMLLTTLTFAVQDSFSRVLASEYNVIVVVAIRYFFFSICILLVCIRHPKKMRAALKTKHLFLQILRGLLLAMEVCVMVFAFTKLGLAKSHAFFSCYPLLVCLLSVPILHEKIGYLRSISVLIGFIGTLIILRPGTSSFSVEYFIPLLSAFLFALYSVVTRYVSNHDSSETSLFWTGVIGAVFMSTLIPFYWQPILGYDILWMAILCFIAILGHFLLIKTLEVSEVSKVQPFAYFQVVFASLFGIFLFSESIDLLSVLGTAIIISSGLLMYLKEIRK